LQKAKEQREAAEREAQIKVDIAGAAPCFSHIELSEGQIAAALAPPTPAAGRES
jgi:hypothetical protein